MSKEKATTNVNGIELIVPKSYEGILPASPYHKLFDFEPNSFMGLKSCLNRDDFAFDIGSSYGVMSALMAKIVGPSGKVFSFEANYDAIEKSKEIISANGLESIIELNNCLVGNYSQKEMDFYVIPSFESVASSISSSILQAHPHAVKKKVKTLRIDDFCSSRNVSPKCIKIDTEGAEFIVVSGMKNLIESNFPDLVIETHGHEIESVGGSLKELTDILESHGYGLFDLKEAKKTSGRDFVLKYFNLNSTILASKKLNDEKYVKRLWESLIPFIKEVEEAERGKKEDATLRELVGKGLYNEIINRLRELPLDSRDADKQYYLAFALHVTGLGPKEALARYEKALIEGFQPFWIYYNRASLYHKMGEIEKAKEDLSMAEQYNKTHPGVKALRKELDGPDRKSD